jgi:hypothetical protein
MPSQKRKMEEIDDHDIVPTLKKKNIEKINQQIIYDESSWDILNNTKYEITNNEFDNYLSATRTGNYLLDDPILDWLNNYYLKYGYNDIDNNINHNIIKNQII